MEEVHRRTTHTHTNQIHKHTRTLIREKTPESKENEKKTKRKEVQLSRGGRGEEKRSLFDSVLFATCPRHSPLVYCGTTSLHRKKKRPYE